MTLGDLAAHVVAGGVGLYTQFRLVLRLSTILKRRGFDQRPVWCLWFNTFLCKPARSLLPTAKLGLLELTQARCPITDGDLSGILNVQVFPNGIQADQQLASGLNFSSIDGAVLAARCADELQSKRPVDDESCLFPCIGIVGGQLSVVPHSAQGRTGPFKLMLRAPKERMISMWMSSEGNWKTSETSRICFLVLTCFTRGRSGCVDSLEVVILPRHHSRSH